MAYTVKYLVTSILIVPKLSYSINPRFVQGLRRNVSQRGGVVILISIFKGDSQNFHSSLLFNTVTDVRKGAGEVFPNKLGGRSKCCHDTEDDTK